MSADAADPTALREVPFVLAFDRRINASTLDASDINATSGNVTNLRDAWPHGADFGSGLLNAPHGVAVNASGHAYVADTENDRVRVFNGTGHLVGNITALFGAPIDVAVGGPHGRVYVADSVDDKIWVFNSTWHHVHDINYTTPGSQFDTPSGVAVDSSGRVYVADRLTHRVYVFNSTWQYVRDVGGQYDQPNGVAVDSSGRVYVADSNNDTVRVYGAAGLPVANITNSFSYPFAVDVDPAGNVFVADANNHRVQVFDGAWQPVANLTRSFNVVTGVGVDPATGDVYASGRNNGRVTVFDAALAFKFDVADPDDQQTLTVRLPAGRVQDPAGNANGESNAASIGIDRIAPVPAINSTHPNPTGAPSVRFTVEFTEAVDGFGAGDVMLSGTAGPAGVVNFTGAGASYAFEASPTADGTILVDIPAGAAEDDAGNGNTAAERFSITHNSSLLTPIVTAAQGSPTNATEIGFRVDFTRPVDGFGAGGIVLSNTTAHGGVANFTNASARAYEFGVSPTRDGTMLVDIPAGAARDAADAGIGSIAAGQFSIEYDGTPPVPTVTAAQQGPTNATTIEFTVNFTEPVRGFGKEGVALSGSAAHGGAAGFAALNSTTYAFGVSPASDGTILVDIPAGAARDDAGNGNTAAERFSIEYDGPPSPIVSSAQASPTNATTIGFAVNFSEPVAGFGAGDVVLSNTTAHGGVANFTNSSARAYAFDVSPARDGTILVDIPAGAAEDWAGNPSTGAARYSVERDATPPAPAVAPTTPGPTSLQVVQFALEFDEPVDASTLDASDLDATSGEVRNLRPAPKHNATFGGHGTGDGNFRSPVDVAVDGSGNIYVAEREAGGNSRVQIFDSGRNHVATIAGLDDPNGVAVDASGNIYVAESDDDRIRVFDSGRNHVAYITGLDHPEGVAVDASGNVYVADTRENAVKIFDSGRNHVATISGLHLPQDVAVDASGNIYVADTNNHRVLVYGPGRNHVATIAGLNSPTGVDTDALGNIYVADRNNDAVKIFDSGRNYVGELPFQFTRPTGVAVDASGNVYVTDPSKVTVFAAAYAFDVADPEDGRLEASMLAGRVLDAAGNANGASDAAGIRIDRTGPVPAVASPQGPYTNATTINFTVTFDEPAAGFENVSITLSGTANPGPADGFNGSGAAYYFSAAPEADGTVTVDVAAGAAQDALGNPSRAAKRFSITYDGTPPVPAVAALQPGPTGLAEVPFGLSFSEPVNASTLEASDIVTTSGNVTSLRAAAWHHDEAFGGPGTGDVEFAAPSGIAVDGSGNTYVADRANDRVQVLDTSRGHVDSITGLSAPRGVAVDASGKIYVADTGGNAVRVYHPNRTRAADLAGQFPEPTGVAIGGPHGRVHVAEKGGSVRVYDPNGTSIGNITALGTLHGVAVDASGSIYVPRAGSDPRVSIYHPDMTRDADLPDSFAEPTGVAVDASGNTYVAASGVDRVRVYGPDRTRIAEIENSLDDPYGVAVDPTTGALYVTEAAGNRIQAFHPSYAFGVADPDDLQTLNVSLPDGGVQDPAGNANEASDAAGIKTDRTRPIPAVALSGTADAATINFTVTFDEDVTGFNETGIALSGTANPGSVADFAPASSTTYAFGAAPTANGTVTVEIPENAAEDDAGNGNEAAQFSVNYTGAPPAPVPTITSDAGPGPARESPIGFTVTFSENVTGFNETGIALSGPAGTGAAVDDFGNASARTYTFDVAPTSVGIVLVDIPEGAAADSDGNGNEAAEQFSIRYTGAVPVPTITSDAGPGPARESPIGFTVTFSENVTGFNETGIALSGPAGTGAAVDDFGNASARTYTFDVAPTSVGIVLVDIPEGAAADSDGNGNEAAEQFSIRYTGAVPVPTITSDAGPGPARESPIGFTVTFSENVTGFNETGIALSGPAGTGAAVDDFGNASARTYTFDVAPTSAGIVLVDIPEGAAADSDGNGNEAAEQFSIRYTGAVPVPTITSDAGPGPARESPIGFTVTFSENVTGFNETGIALSGPAGTGAAVDDFGNASARTYTFDVAPTSVGIVLVDIPEGAAADSDGNGNEAAEQFSIRYTGAVPVPTITSDAGPGPARESPIGFTVTFSEDVTGFNETGIALSGPAGTGAAVDDFGNASARTYTFDVAPTSVGIVLVDIPEGAAADSDGNGNEAAEQFSIEYAGGAPPAVPFKVESAAITGPGSITIRYSAGANAAGSAYHSIVVGGTPRNATLAGAGTDAHVLRFGGDPAARDATGAVTINQTAVADPAGRPLGSDAAYRQALADGQAPLLASAVLDLTAGENGLLTLEFDEAVAAAPDARSFAGEIAIRGDGGEVALSRDDIPSAASGRAGGTEFALDISGAKRVELNAADLGPAAIELPAAFVSDAPGNEYAPGRQPVPLAHVPDPSPPRLVMAAFNLAPGSGNAGRLVMTFDKAATAPGAQSFPGMIEIRGRSWGGDAAVTLSAADILSVESGSTGDRTFVLLVSDRARAALDAAAFSVPESTTLLLPAGFVTDGRAANAPERAPLDVARDPDRPSFLLAFVLNGSSMAAVYSEPVLAVPSHYANITVGGAAVAGNGGGASGAAAFGNNVVVSWNANASTAASAGSAVGFDLSANVTDAFGNPVENPGEKSTGGPDGTGQAGKRPVQVGVFARGAADPSAEAARLGAAAFNAVSEERGYEFYVSVSEHDLPAGASGAAALRGAHAAGEGPSLYVGPASDMALAGMAGYASENGITIISHSSAARSLAVEGDPIFRMEPGAAHLARVLATEVARGGYGAIVPVVQAGLHGPDYGLLESMESDLEPLGIPFGDPVAFVAGGGGAAAAPIETAVAEAAGSGTARSVAVVYVGSDMELAAMAGSVPAGGPVRERSAWFAAGGAGAGAGSGVAASPAILDDAAAMQLARDTRLSAVQFAVERNGITDYIDRIAAPRGPATSATPAYAAYEAVRALGGALVGAGGDPSLARGNVAGAAALAGGPLGRTGMDGSGDLRLPVTYGAWSVSDVSAEWARAPELLRGLDACGIDLEKSALALPDLSAGSTSRPARQTVTNIGTGPMPAVSVSATDWAQFRDGAPLPGPLPFSYTEMAVGLGGASPRPADSTPLAAGTEIPGGTPPGGSVDVDFRINLEGLDDLEADFISQTVTFVVNCV